MNKIIYTVLTALMVIAALSSCSDFLDKEPKTELSPNTFWKTESDLRFGLNSLYANMNRSYTLDNQSIDCFAAIGNPVSSGTYTHRTPTGYGPPPTTTYVWYVTSSKITTKPRSAMRSKRVIAARPSSSRLISISIL